LRFLFQTSKTDEGDVSERPEYMGSKSDPSVKKLPSHLGPKIRHKNPTITRKAFSKQEKDKKNPKKNRKREASESAVQYTEAPEPKKARKSSNATRKSEKKVKKVRQEQADEKKFNSLVQSYKSRLMGGAENRQKSKWFE
jgi:nucleolar protein 4